MASTSVADPNTLNLDPFPGVWPNLDPDPWLCYKLLYIFLKASVEKTFLLKALF